MTNRSRPKEIEQGREGGEDVCAFEEAMYIERAQKWCYFRSTARIKRDTTILIFMAKRCTVLKRIRQYYVRIKYMPIFEFLSSLIVGELLAVFGGP